MLNLVFVHNDNTGTKQSGSAFYLFKVVQKTISGHQQKCQLLLSPETLRLFWSFGGLISSFN